MNTKRRTTDAAPSMAGVSSRSESSLKSVRYWTLIIGLALVSTLPALEGTVVSTALPSITADLQGDQTFVWIINAYFLASTVFQPLYGQLSDILGRKPLILIALAAFLLGSGLCGGASSISMMIAGRTIQGLGGGGVTMMVDLVVCDLVPVRERGSVMGIIMAFATIGTALGPIIGGIMVDDVTWRWAFYINLPVAATAGIVLILAFREKKLPSTTIQEKAQRIDFFGNLIFIPSAIAVLLALADASSEHPWSSWNVILPLVLGIVGLMAFLGYEFSPYCRQDSAMVPQRLFSNRTSTTVYILTFLHTLLLTWVIYFLPVFFQGVLGSSPTRSGVQLLPTVIPLMVFAVIGGVAMEKSGTYRTIHFCGFGLMSVGIGLFTTIGASSSIAQWTVFQLLFAAGTGLSIGTLLAAIQAGLGEGDAALSTGFWAFTRSFGTVCGVAISSTVFNAQTTLLAGSVQDESTRNLLSNGTAYQHATKSFLQSVSPSTAAELKNVFSRSLQTVWYAALAFALLSFLCVFFERQLDLRTELETEFGLAKSSGKTQESQLVKPE